MRYLTLSEVLSLYRRIISSSSGILGIRDLGALESALAQPRMVFGGADLYPTIAEKAASLCFSLVNNHPFVDGNKRTGHAAMEVFLILNGYELQVSEKEQERVILRVASGKMDREAFSVWLQEHIIERHLVSR